MTLDHAQSVRLAQRGVAPTPGIQLVTVPTLPEVAYRGQIVYALDIDEFRVFDGSAWQVPTAAASGGVQSFVSATEPAADAVGDLWLQTTTYQMFVWDGTFWRPLADPDSDSKKIASYRWGQYLLNDGVNSTRNAYFSATTPTTPFTPVNGEYWFKTDTNQVYRRTAGSWVEFFDAGPLSYFHAVAIDESTIDLVIKVWFQTTQPWANGATGHGSELGDLWFDTDDANTIYRWSGTWVKLEDTGPVITASVADDAHAIASAAQITANAALDAATPDGSAPSSSPAPTLIGGIRQIFVKWTAISNADPVTYDVQLSLTTGSGFTTVGSTIGSSFNITVENPDYQQTYFVRIIARDADGSATASSEASTLLTAINTPDIASNSILANNILAGEITAGHLSSTFFESGNIQTASAGRRVVIDTTGIRLLDTDETVIVQLNTSDDAPATFNGEVQADALTVQDNLEVRGTNNAFATGSVTTLSAGITNSAIAPTATVGYATAASNLDTTYFRTQTVDWGGTYSYYARRFFQQTVLERRDVVGQDGPSHDGQGIFTQQILGAARSTVSAVEYINLLGPSYPAGGKPSISDYRLKRIRIDTWSSSSFTVMLNTAWTHDTGVVYFKPSIGRNWVTASEVVTAEVLASQTQIRFRRYETSTNTNTATVTTTGVESALAAKPDKGILGCGYGDFGMGVGNFYWAAFNDVIWAFNTSGAYQVAWAFYPASSQLAFNYNPSNSKFMGYINDDTNVVTYSDHDRTNTAPTTSLWCSYTWYDNAGTTHETTQSAQKKFTMKKRGQVVVATPSLPGAGGADEPNAVRFYFGGPSSTAPARTAMWDQATEPSTGVLMQTYDTFRLVTGGGAVNPPATNNYPTATGGIVQSGALATDASPFSIIRGDGTGRLLEMILGQQAVKTSDQTINSTTAANVTDLAFSGTINSIYDVELNLLLTSNGSNQGLNITWTLPSGTTWNGYIVSPGYVDSTNTGVTTNESTTANFRAATGAAGFALVSGTPGAGNGTFGVWCKYRFIISSTAGTVQLQLAQNNSVVAGVVVKAGTWLTARRIL